MKYLPNVKLAIISPNPERLGKTFQEEIFMKPTMKILKGYTFSNCQAGRLSVTTKYP